MIKLVSGSNFFLSRWLSMFANSIVSSVSDLNYYVSVLNSPVKSSLKTVGWFYIFVGAILTFVFSIRTLPEFSRSLDSAREELTSQYPSDLSFHWDGQTLSSTLNGPLEIDYPQAFPPNPDAPKKFLRIDTTSNKGPDNFQTLMYINQKDVFVNSYQGEWTQAPLSGILSDTAETFDRSKILELADTSKSMQQEVVSIAPFVAFLSFSIGLFVVRLFGILIDALILQFFFQLIRKPIAYKKVFQLCLHLLIPVEIITQFSAIVFPHLAFPMFSLSFWILSALLLWHLRNLHIFRLEKKAE